MDAISYSYADKQAKRIKKFINNPDSNSGIVTVPKVIEAGDSVTVPAGRVAVLPNVQVDGTLNVEGDGEIFIPAGATLSKVVELEGNQTIPGVKTFSSSPIVPTPTTGTQVANKNYVDTKQSKAEVAYNVNSSSYVPNTLSSGAIIERGSNANGEYVKFADGTLICTRTVAIPFTGLSEQAVAYPATFINTKVYKTFDVYDYLDATGRDNAQNVYLGGTALGTEGKWNIRNQSSATFGLNCSLMAIGKWK